MSARIIRLPKHLGLREMRSMITQLAISYSKSVRNEWQADFKPRAGERGIEIDRSRVEVATAESEAQFHAILSWLQANQEGKRYRVQISTSDGRNMAPYLARARRPERSLDKSLMLFQAAKPVELPNLNAATSDRRRDSQRIAREVDLLAEAIEQQLTPYKRIGEYHRNILVDWAAEFLAECLLNVAQHAALSPSITTVSARVAVAYLANTDFQSLIDSRSDPTAPLDESVWLNRLGGYSPGCLDIAVADCGLGIPRTLSEAYKRVMRGDSGDIASPSTEEPHEDEVMIWAMSAFGTRKRAEDFVSKHDAMTWRGLYRLLRRCTNHDGQFRIISSSGEAACILDEAAQRIPLEPQGSRPRSPVTTVRAVVPIFAKALKTRDQMARSKATTTIKQIAGIIVAPPAPLSPAVEFSKAISAYAHSTRVVIESAVEKQPDNNYPWIVIHAHPPLYLGVDGNTEVGYSRKKPDQRFADLAVGIISQTLSPTHNLIHTFLPGSDKESMHMDVIDLLTRHVEALGNPLSIGSVVGQTGIAFGGGRRVRWLLSPNDSAVKQSTPFQLKNLWTRLIAYRPEAALVRDHPVADLAPDIVRQIATKYLRTHVEQVDSVGTYTPRIAWFWRSKEHQGESSQVVVTASGRRATQYLGVLRLCDEHPLFLYGIADALASALKTWPSPKPKGNPRTIVVTDSESSKFLLNRVQDRFSSLDFSNTSRASSDVFFIDRLEAAAFQGESIRCLLFADYRDQGHSIRKRIEEIYTVAPTGTSISIQVFLAIDQAGRPSGFDPNLNDPDERYRPAAVVVYCDYQPIENAPPASAAAQLTIDPVTSEPFSEEQSAETEQLKTIAWAAAPSDDAVDLSSTKFVHGIERTGGHYVTIRWPVSENLKNEVVIEAIARRLSNFVGSGDQEVSLCVCYRQGSSFHSSILRILGRTVELCGVVERTSRITLWYTALTSQVFHGNQSLGGSVQQALRVATKFSNQLNLQLEHTHLTVYGEAPFSHIAFLDNSAVTGRAIFEFLLSARSLNEYDLPQPSNLLLFPLVTRLSAFEERLLRSIRLVEGGRSPRSGVNTLGVAFSSLVQLRLPTYTDARTLPLFAELQLVLQRSSSSDEPHFRQLSQAIRTVIGRLESSARSQHESIHHGSALGVSSLASPPRRGISMRAVEFRQLLALAEQGVPCTAHAARALADLQQNGSSDLVNILAFEPHLLRTDPLMFEASGDIRKLALRVAFEESSLSDMVIVSNVLWVLSHIPSGLAQFVREAPKRLLEIDLAQKLLIFLCLYCIDAAETAKVNDMMRQRRQRGELSGWLEEQGQMLLVAAENETRRLLVPVESERDAQDAIRRYLREGRRDHAGILSEEWRKAQDVLNSLYSPSFREGSVNAAAVLTAVKATQNWIWGISFPVQSALEFMSTTRRRELRNRIKTERDKSVRLLSELEMRAQAIADGRGTENQLRTTWRSLLHTTLWDTPENAYTLSVRAHHKKDRASPKATEEGLALLANTPLLILLSELNRNLENETDIEVLLDIPSTNGRNAVKVTGKILDIAEKQGLIKEFWFVRRPLALLWQKEAIAFRTICGILSENLRHYANLAAGIQVTLKQIERPGSAELTLSLTSTTHNSPREFPGNGVGRPTIYELVAANKWNFEDGALLVAGKRPRYQSTIAMGVDLIELGAPPVA